MVLFFFFVCVFTTKTFIVMNSTKTKSGMDHSDSPTTLGAVVHSRLMQTLALNIILKNTASLHGCIQTDANDTAAEEQEDKKPLHARPARALPFHFCKS